MPVPYDASGSQVRGRLATMEAGAAVTDRWVPCESLAECPRPKLPHRQLTGILLYEHNEGVDMSYNWEFVIYAKYSDLLDSIERSVNELNNEVRFPEIGGTTLGRYPHAILGVTDHLGKEDNLLDLVKEGAYDGWDKSWRPCAVIIEDQDADAPSAYALGEDGVWR
jgi:hypothetical protein